MSRLPIRDGNLSGRAGIAKAARAAGEFRRRVLRASRSAGSRAHDTEKACPGRDPGWVPVSEKIMLLQ
jgi:hypothetical protein